MCTCGINQQDSEGTAYLRKTARGRKVSVDHLSEDDKRELDCLPLNLDAVETDDYDEIFEFIKGYDPQTEGQGAIFVLCDWHNYIGNNPRDPGALDQQKVLLMETAKTGTPKTVIMLNPQQWNIPVELEQIIRVVDLPLPDKEDRMSKVTYYLDAFRGNPSPRRKVCKGCIYDR